MPGIVGLITTKPRQWAEAELLRMVETMEDRTLYVSGTCIDERQHLYVGWVAHKGSFAAKMPLQNESKSLTLFFSGEDYPEPGLISRLKEKGHSFDCERASYLSHLAEENADFPRQLNGRFHGCLADRHAGRLTIFNDRFGMHRLYYHEAKEAFYFAAAAKAILAVCPQLRTVDPESLAELILCGCTLENRSIFRDLHVLPPASAWIFRNGSLEKKAAYFEPQEWEDQPILDEERYYRQLREVFARILAGYFSGTEMIGMSLTGGLDSRMILSWHKMEPGSLPCYSFVGPYRDCQDVIMARKVAHAIGQPHQVIQVGQEFLSKFPDYCERLVFLTDGCLGIKHTPDLYVNERAALIAPVRMTGNYGGEVLRAVRAFKPVDPMPGLFVDPLSSIFQQAKQTYSRQLAGHPLSFAVFRQAPWHHYGLLCLEQSQLTLRSPYVDNEFVKMVYQAPQSALAGDHICLRLVADGNPALRKIRTDRGLGGSLARPAAALLRDYLEFTFKAEYAYDYGMPQWLARADHVVSGLHLERLFLGRHKFYHFRTWYRKPLSDYVREMLLDPLTLSRPYLNRKAVETVVQGHMNGDCNYTNEIHILLSLELLHRVFIDRKEN